MRSRAFIMANGSYVLRVVRTVMLPSTKLSSHATPTSASALVTPGHASRRYFSRYFGNRHANDDSSVSPPVLSSGRNGVTFQWSMLSLSHGLGFSYCAHDVPCCSAERGQRS